MYLPKHTINNKMLQKNCITQKKVIFFQLAKIQLKKTHENHKSINLLIMNKFPFKKYSLKVFQYPKNYIKLLWTSVANYDIIAN